MFMRKVVGVCVALSVASWAATPVSAHPYHHFHHFRHFVGGGHFTPWPAFLIIGGVASVMTNAAIVWNTQCRQLTSEEAVTSFLLPVVGIAFDASNNQCKRHP